MTLKDEYLGSILTMQELMNAGYSQKGYESILRLDTWIEQKCTQHTTTETVNIANVNIYVDSVTMRTIALREFVKELDNRNIDEFNVHNNLRCDDDDGYQNFVGGTGVGLVGQVNLYVEAKIEGASFWVNGNSAYGGVGNPGSTADGDTACTSSTTTSRTITFGAVAYSGNIIVRVGFTGSTMTFGSLTATGLI
jgi:hypothetical protein